MQENLTIAANYFPVTEIKEIENVAVPWIVKSYADDFKRAETTGGLFDFSHYGVLKVIGSDSADYLNRMSTINLKNFNPRHANVGAFLTGKASTISMVTILEREHSFEIIVPHPYTQKTFKHLDKFHFSERLEIENVSEQFALFGLYRPSLKLRSLLKIENWKPLEIIFRRWVGFDWTIWKDARIPDFYWVKAERSQTSSLLEEINSNPELPLLGLKTYDYIRIANGIPEIGKDILDGDIFLEANYEEAIARGKGCYPGQEVIERISTYGQVNKKVMKVNVALSDKTVLGELPQVIRSADKIVGSLSSLEEDPKDPSKAIGLASIHKDFWESRLDYSTDLGHLVSVAKEKAV